MTKSRKYAFVTEFIHVTLNLCKMRAKILLTSYLSHFTEEWASSGLTVSPLVSFELSASCGSTLTFRDKLLTERGIVILRNGVCFELL